MVLAVTPEDSAVWRIARKVEHLFLINCERPTEASDAVARFLSACRNRRGPLPVPAEFKDGYLSETFLAAVGL